MRRAKPGFTLIELMMVVLIIGLLIVMLVPAVSAVKKAVRTQATQNMIWEIDSAIGLYKDTFGDYPPSGKPLGADWSGYPDGWVPDDPSATAAGHNPGYGPFDVNNGGGAPGGQYLTYFLFGPERLGWTTSEHGVSASWTPPQGLEKYLTKKPLRNIGHSSHYYYITPPYWYFEDAFGLTGYKFRGAILYLRANTQNRSPMVGSERNHARWIYGQIESQYYWSCRGGSWGYTGDNEPQKNLARLLKQCPKGFALISAGADQGFGYRAKNTHANNKDHVGADWDDGASDDITNFVHD
ncbi:MAG: prepilin-type N-terminal cleavage/methylation domain-containing protein [Anaerolineaceae bacterium]|nr:prepilin-type N-terminal cleavage/methylation domain-containing protein [Anaerolineaceae bacterium]